MITMAKLDFIPLCCSFLDSSRQALSRLAISDNESSKIYIYDGKSKILQIFHENLDFYKQLHERLQLKQQDNEDKKSNIIILNNVEYSRRLTIVKDLEKYSIINPLINFQFNSSDTFIFYSIFYGIKINNPQDNRSEHDKNRDIYNEKPSREEILTATGEEVLSSLSQSAMIYTTYGGQSIWGKDFQDEFNPQLKRECPYTLSVANAGPNINVSQFFITVVPCP
ncbi:unnamed protein product [Rotaria magnacalcarata]|uniref:peptidylprolyl isomerase n=1 Tax=Rotaria magnacalcarata TaxID=392030 RepID=A0A817AGU6_9BILA|nr:unnamed protein product [Rotaria magnacalcarata]